MEFHTEREEALYSTLKQVLYNHVVTHRLGYGQILAACIPVLGYLLYIMSETWEEAPALIAHTVTELQQRTRRRALQAPPGLPPWHYEAPHTPLSPQYHELGTALATLLTSAGIEYDMSVTATWRAYLSLLADVLAMPIHTARQTPQEAAAFIASLRNQLPVLMQMWDEERQ
jgi:hypothetical protein